MQACQSPIISHHLVQLHSTHTTVDSSSNSSLVYTNVRDITSVRVNWVGSYQPSGLPAYSSVPYISDVDLGITRAVTNLRFKGEFEIKSLCLKTPQVL